MNRPAQPMVTPRPLAQRIGVMQGRLVAPADGGLEASAGDRWREEFSIAARIDLNHIELLAERFTDGSNPIWSAEGRRELLSVAGSSGVQVASLCVNEPLSAPFDDEARSDDLAQRLAPVVSELQIGIVVLPLLEASDLGRLDQARSARCVQRLAVHLGERGARVALEVGVPAADGAAFLDATAPALVGLCYDVGNATAQGLDAPAELRALGSHVWHVHAKDKNRSNENVRFGTGEVSFGAVLVALADTGFDGLVTMEATRGDDPAVTAAEHRAFLLDAEQSALRGRRDRHGE